MVRCITVILLLFVLPCKAKRARLVLKVPSRNAELIRVWEVVNQNLDVAEIERDR
jgi:hypothetical protein